MDRGLKDSFDHLPRTIPLLCPAGLTGFMPLGLRLLRFQSLVKFTGLTPQIWRAAITSNVDPSLLPGAMRLCIIVITASRSSVAVSIHVPDLRPCYRSHCFTRVGLCSVTAPSCLVKCMLFVYGEFYSSEWYLQPVLQVGCEQCTLPKRGTCLA